jgi:hypothetical protein
MRTVRGITIGARAAGITGMEVPKTQTAEAVDESGSWRADEPDRIYAWRLAALKRAGFHDDTAFSLATGEHVDLHLALKLVDRGCPVETAARILL